MSSRYVVSGFEVCEGEFEVWGHPKLCFSGGHEWNFFPPAKAGGYSRNGSVALAHSIIVFFWSQKKWNLFSSSQSWR